jgi:hypothetical protein
MHRYRSHDRLAGRIVQRGYPLGEDGAWGNHVDPHVVGSIIQGGGPGQPDNTMFPGNVGRNAHDARNPGFLRLIKDKTVSLSYNDEEESYRLNKESQNESY